MVEHDAVIAEFSPHPWGWTGNHELAYRSYNVFPTPVGMDRRQYSAQDRDIGFPHTRGDGPGL